MQTDSLDIITAYALGCVAETTTIERAALRKQESLLTAAGYDMGRDFMPRIVLKDYWLRVARQPTPRVEFDYGDQRKELL